MPFVISLEDLQNFFSSNFIIDVITKDSIVYFENDDSILFQYKEEEQRFVRFVPNKFRDRDIIKIAVPYDYTVLTSGDLIYDPIMQKYYRFYNGSIGLLSINITRTFSISHSPL